MSVKNWRIKGCDWNKSQISSEFLENAHTYTHIHTKKNVLAQLSSAQLSAQNCRQTTRSKLSFLEVVVPAGNQKQRRTPENIRLTFARQRQTGCKSDNCSEQSLGKCQAFTTIRWQCPKSPTLLPLMTCSHCAVAWCTNPSMHFGCPTRVTSFSPSAAV